ncbi:hypothetical protein IAU60_002212 [Kwoniella sp. DSM 27419]
MERARLFAKGVRGVHPDKWMAHNIAFDEDCTKLSEEQVRTLPEALATMGYAWQSLPLSDLPTVSQEAKMAIQAIKDHEFGSYLHRVSTGEVRHHVPTTSSKWWWRVMGKAANQAADAIRHV